MYSIFFSYFKYVYVLCMQNNLTKSSTNAYGKQLKKMWHRVIISHIYANFFVCNNYLVKYIKRHF